MPDQHVPEKIQAALRELNCEGRASYHVLMDGGLAALLPAIYEQRDREWRERLLDGETIAAVRWDRDKREAPDDQRDKSTTGKHVRGINIGADLRAAITAAFPEEENDG